MLSIDNVNVPLNADGTFAPGDYGEVTVSNATGRDTPRLKVEDTETLDRLTLTGLTLTAKTNVFILPIVFTHMFNPGPIGLLTKVDHIDGFFAKPGGAADVTGEVVFLGDVGGDPVGDIFSYGVPSPNMNLQALFFNDTDTEVGVLAGPRALTGRIRITLAKGHSLTLPNSAFVAVVPEPGTFVLVGGILALYLLRRNARR